MRRGEHGARAFAPVVETRERYDIFVRRNLKHRICRRIQDRSRRRYVLATKSLDDFGSRCRDVSERCDTADRHESLDDDGGKAARVSRKRDIGVDACHFPVPGDRVLAFRYFTEPRDVRMRRRGARYAANICESTESVVVYAVDAS